MAIRTGEQVTCEEYWFCPIRALPLGERWLLLDKETLDYRNNRSEITHGQNCLSGGPVSG